ncbi:hypothetical protein CBL_12427 [Carabus blaptoides fortunei]
MEPENNIVYLYKTTTAMVKEDVAEWEKREPSTKSMGKLLSKSPPAGHRMLCGARLDDVYKQHDYQHAPSPSHHLLDELMPQLDSPRAQASLDAHSPANGMQIWKLAKRR